MNKYQNSRKVYQLPLIVISLSFVITILFFELILRIIHVPGAGISWTMPDVNLGYRFVPGDYFWAFREGDIQTTLHINRDGWIGPEWKQSKPDGNIRVALLGDSFIEGLQVDPRDRIVSVAERSLHQKIGPHVELMNFSRSGYGQTEQLFLLQNEVLRFDPDVIVNFFFPGNDIADSTRITATNTLRPFYSRSDDDTWILDNSFVQTSAYRIRSWIDPLKRRSIFISMLLRAYTQYMRGKTANSLETDIFEGYLSLCTDQPEAQLLRSYQWTQQLITRSAFIAQEHDLPFLLVTLNSPIYESDDFIEILEMAPNLKLDCFERDMHILAQRLEIFGLGLHTLFEDTYNRDQTPLHWPRDGHWNALGHRVAGLALAAKLIDILN